MAFTLSPGVTTREYNLTGYVPNLPSTRTGMVLRANQGPCLDVTAITNENDLVSVFGYPDSTNYQDWFQAWNFLQYASSLYIARPMSSDVTNAGIALTGESFDTTFEGNLYNARVAETTLENMSDAGAPLTFFKKDVTSDQRDAIAVCSKPSVYNDQIGLEYYAIVSSTDGSNTVSTSENTLVKGSQVLLNGSNLATVTSIDASGNVTFDRTVSSIDVAAFYMVATAAEEAVTDSVYSVIVSKNNFNAKVGSLFLLGTGSIQPYYISGIANYDANSYRVYLTHTLGSVESSAAPAITSGETISSSTMFYKGKVAAAATLGSTILKLESGFVLESGVQITITGVAGTYNIVSVDSLNNQITLASGIATAIPASAVSSATLFDIQGQTSVSAPKPLLGINYFDQIYDDSIIVKTKTSVNLPTGGTKNIFVQSLASFGKLFQFPPNWSNGEFGLVLLVKDKITNLYKLNKTYILSYNQGAKNRFGSNIFAEKVLFDDGTSPVYVKVGDITQERPNTTKIQLPKFVNDVAGSNIYPQMAVVGGYGYDGTAYTQGDVQNAQDLFSDPETFDINILISNELDPNGMATIAETRKDCVAVVVPFNYQFLATNGANACTEYLLDNFGTQTYADDKIFTTFGTYSAIYGNMKYQYDKYNDVNRWVNVAGDVAGLFAQTDQTNDTWWAPAGAARGVIKNCIKLAFNPNKQNRDDLYVNGVNPIMAIAGEGNAVVYGQKTATALPSAMDRVNVRRLLIYLEKSIATSARLGLFEFNDTFTRTRLFGIIDPFLRNVKSKRGLYGYKLVIDDSNNTAEVIDGNGLVIDIYLQPTKVAEFINLNMVVVPTGVSFNEVVGKYGG